MTTLATRKITKATEADAAAVPSVTAPAVEDLTAERVQALVDELIAARSNMGSALDLPRHLSERQVQAFVVRQRELDATAPAVMRGWAEVSTLTPELTAAVREREMVEAIAVRLSNELSGYQKDDPKRENVALSLRAVDHGAAVFTGSGRMIATSRLGELLGEHGVTAPPPDASGRRFDPLLRSRLELDETIARLRVKRDDAVQALAHALATAQRLLVEPTEVRTSAG